MRIIWRKCVWFWKMDQSFFLEKFRNLEILQKFALVRQYTIISTPLKLPMINSTEEVLSKIKFYARNILTDPSNRKHLVDVINHLFVTITLTDCHNHYINICI